MTIGALLLAAVILTGIFIVVNFMLKPLRLFFALLFALGLGVLLLVLTNLLLSPWGLHIAVNPVTVLTTALLQLPGAVMLVLLRVLFG